MEPEKDMENFVRDYGTGSNIPDPPPFVNYTNASAVPTGSERPTSRPAQFARSTQRHLPFKAPPPVQDDEPFVNTAGVGAVGAVSRNGTADLETQPARSQSQSRASIANGNPPPPSNGLSRHPTNAALSRQSTASASVNQNQSSGQGQNDGHTNGAPDGSGEQYMLKVGNGAYRVDPSNDPQQAPAAAPSRGNSQASDFLNGEDPLAARMNELKSAVTSQPSQRRNSTYRPTADGQSQSSSDVSRKPTQGGLSLSPPSSSSGATPASRNDYRKSAEVVVGAYPGSGAVSRPVSPNPPAPTASLTRPPEQKAPPSSLGDVESVLQSYGQAMPGERKSQSRRNSFIGTPNNANMQGQSIERAPSREGHVGIGAHGVSRSPSPQPQPAPGPASRRNSRVSPAPTQTGSMGRATSTRAPSTNSVGIALDPSGKVAVDAMADRYRQPQPQQQQQQQQPQQPQPTLHHQPQQAQPSPSPSYNNVAPQPASSRNPSQSQMSYGSSNPNMAPPAQQPAYAPPPQPAYQQQPAYNPPPPQQQYVPPQAAYAQPPPAHYAPPPPAPTQNVYQPHQSYSGGSLGRAPSNAANAGYGNSHLTSPQHPYAAGGRTPSPQPLQPSPTGAYTDDGRPILFYGKNSPTLRVYCVCLFNQSTSCLFIVKALYDYGATIDEEFDFQSGDIIAVTATPEDGWWSGELLDEARRVPGRHVFPSNFVCLF